MALDELYDGYCVECNHCLRHYRFDPRRLTAAHRKLVSLDEHGIPRADVLKGKATIARIAIRDGWVSYTATTNRFSSTCHLCPDCQKLNDYGETFD